MQSALALLDEKQKDGSNMTNNGFYESKERMDGKETLSFSN